jgi:26S proteasome regulatory subunit N5
MSDGKLEKMDKDFSPQVDVLLPETEALTKVRLVNDASK